MFSKRLLTTCQKAISPVYHSIALPAAAAAIASSPSKSVFGLNTHLHNNRYFAAQQEQEQEQEEDFRIPERFLGLADLWVDKPCGLFAMAFFSRVLYREIFNMNLAAVDMDMELLVTINTDLTALAGYIAGGANFSDEEIDVCVQNNVLWTMGNNDEQRQVIVDGIKMSEGDAKALAAKIVTECPEVFRDAIMGLNLHWSLIAAGQDGLKPGQLERYYATAANLGFEKEMADEFYQLYLDEVNIYAKAKKLYNLS